MIKSYSQDQESSNQNIKEDKNDNNICHSESCSELHSSISSTVSNTSVSGPQRSTSDTNNRSENLLQKSLDEETASTDSNSTDNKSITGKKRSFFGLRKRKSSKHSSN
jgi:hypothetical protein